MVEDVLVLKRRVTGLTGDRIDQITGFTPIVHLQHDPVTRSEHTRIGHADLGITGGKAADPRDLRAKHVVGSNRDRHRAAKVRVPDAILILALVTISLVENHELRFVRILATQNDIRLRHRDRL